jgi:hypothetical protein
MAAAAHNTPRVAGTAGTGAHLMKMREKKGPDGMQPVASGVTFDFEVGLNIFKKDEVLAKVGVEKEKKDDQGVVKEAPKYKKDDFFDTMSCDLTDRQVSLDLIIHLNFTFTSPEPATLNFAL